MPMGIGLGIGVTRGGGVGWWQSGSALDLYFAESLGFNSIDRTKTTPDSILTYTAPSPKMVYGSDGVLRYAPHNLMLQSQDFNTASWTKAAQGNGVTPVVTPNSHTAPDGTMTASRVQFARGTASFSNRSQLRQSTASTLPMPTRGSVWLKSFDGTTQYVSLVNSAANTGNVQVVVTGDWQRFDAAFTNVISTNQLWIGLHDTLNAVLTADVLVWGAQISFGTTLYEYIPTTTAAVYSLPIDHNPTTFAPLGVLIEEQRTNLLTYSEQFDNAAWLKSNVSVTGASINAAVAPDGTMTADALVENTTTSVHEIYRLPGTGAGTYTLSLYVKANGRTQLKFTQESGGDSLFTISGSGTAVALGSNTVSIASVGDGWYRCSSTFTTTGAFGVYISLYNSGASNYTGDGVSGIYLWGAQLEAGAFATSYIPTTNNPLGVTRLADQVSILTSAFGYNATAGTMVVEARVNALKSASNRIASLYGPASRLADLYVTFDSNLAYYKTSDSSQVTIGSGVAAQTPFKVGIAYKLNDYQGVLGGTLGGADTSTGALPTNTSTLGIGNWNNDSASILSGHIKRLTYFPTRRSDAELQVLTT